MPARFSGSAALIDDQRAVGGRAADLAQPLDRVRQRELFAGHAGDEPSAANLAARFEAAIDARQLAPRRAFGFAREQPAEHDAVAPQQRPRLTLDRRFTRRRVLALASQIDHAPTSVPARRMRARARRAIARARPSRRAPTIARRPAKPSEAIRPAATSSPSARRTSASSSFAAAISSRRNDAPRRAQHVEHLTRVVAQTSRRSRRVVIVGGSRSVCQARRVRAGTARSALRRPRVAATTAAPSRPRRSGTACRASTARSDRGAPAGP